MEKKKDGRGRSGRAPKKQTGIPVFVRVAPDIKDFLEKLGNLSATWTEKFVIERSLQHLQRIPPHECEFILGGPALINRVGSLLALQSWANHAFSVGHWHWAALCYERLWDDSGTSSDEKAFALYRLGFIYLEIAIELRTAALHAASEKSGEPNDAGQLEKDWKKLYDHAIIALGKSIYYGQEAEELIWQPLLPYNVSCAFSLKGSFTIEKHLRWNSKLGQALVTEGDSPDGMNRAWGRIGSEWRDELRPKGAVGKFDLQEEVEEYASQCMSNLWSFMESAAGQESSTSFSSKEQQRVPAADPFFVLRFAKKKPDPDLCFVRYDTEFKGDFDRWLTAAEKDEGWALRAFNQLESLMKSQKRTS